MSSLDICDNFVRASACLELSLLIKDNLALRNLNLSDCLTEEENETVITALEVLLLLQRNLKTENGKE